jgi:hypothetical protein
MFEADIGINALGIGIHRADGAVRFAYPIAVAAATRR